MEEKKVSPKFTTKLASDKLPEDPNIEELMKWCAEFEKSGLMPCYGEGSFGNLSFRTNGTEFIITASGMKDPSLKESFVEVSSVDMDERIVYGKGKKKPSSESMLHYAIYKQRKDVNAVFHGHCEKILKFAGEYGIPTTSKYEPYGTIELVQSVLDVLRDNDLLIMKDHGFISLGENMDKAGERALSLLDRIDKKEKKL
jgi:L-fuculose-phosphate aldolase